VIVFLIFALYSAFFYYSVCPWELDLPSGKQGRNNMKLISVYFSINYTSGNLCLAHRERVGPCRISIKSISLPSRLPQLNKALLGILVDFRYLSLCWAYARPRIYGEFFRQRQTFPSVLGDLICVSLQYLLHTVAHEHGVYVI